MKCKYLLTTLLTGFSLSSTLLYAQTITSDPISMNVANFTLTGEYNPTTGDPYNTLYFILFGDGQFASGVGQSITRMHRYQPGFNGSATAFFAKNKDSSPPPMIVSLPVVFGTTANTFSNPSSLMPNNVKLSSSWTPVAGQQHCVILSITNKCTGNNQSGSIKFYYNAPQITYNPGSFSTFNAISGTVSCTSIVPTTSLNFNQICTWSYSNLLPGEQRHYFLSVNVDPSNAVSTSINYRAVITQSKPCVQSTSANTSNLTLTPGAFPHDPNKKTVDTENICSNSSAVPLEYHISFQNDGSAEAHDVWVYDDLDATQLDPASVVLSSWSHPCQLQPIAPGGNTAIFEFLNINLPGLNQVNPYQYAYSETVGEFSFKIYTLPNLSPGVIPNIADVQFDALAFVQTDFANVYINENTGNDDCPIRDRANAQSNSSTETLDLAISPNPFTDHLKINPISMVSGETGLLEVRDLSGKCLTRQILFDAAELTLDTANWPTGIYFTSFQTSRGLQVQRVIKQ